MLLVVVFGALRADVARASSPLAFQVEHVQRAEDLGPMAANMFGSLSGVIGVPARAAGESPR